MSNHNRELAINTVILGIGQLVPKFLALIVLPVLTAYLSTEEYGIYDFVLSIAGLLIPILTLQIQQAVFRYLLGALERKNKEQYVTTSISYVLASSVILLPVVYGILYLIHISAGFRLLICCLFFFETFYNLLGQIVRGLGYNIKYSISVIIYATVNMFFIVLLVAVCKTGLYGVMFSLILGYSISDIYMLLASGVLKYINIHSISKSTLRQLMNFSIPIVPSSIALWIVNLSDRMIIMRFLGTSANGIYAVSNKIPTLYNTAYSVFNIAWTETASRVSDDGDPSEYYSSLFKGLFNFLIGTMLVMITATPLVFKLLVKGDYGEAVSQVPVLYFGAFFNSFVNFYSGIYIALKRTKQVGISSAAGAILNIIINFALIKRFGLYAASFSTALSFMVIVLYRGYDLNKVIKIKYDFRDIIIGMIIFICGSLLLSIGNIWCIIACFILAVAYNVIFNLTLFGKIFKIIIYKR